MRDLPRVPGLPAPPDLSQTASTPMRPAIPSQRRSSGCHSSCRRQGRRSDTQLKEVMLRSWLGCLRQTLLPESYGASNTTRCSKPFSNDPYVRDFIAAATLFRGA